MGMLSRRKGAAWERELVLMFREAMPGCEVRRGLQSRSGEEVADVDCPVFWIEAKRGRQPNVRNALRQAVAAAPKGRIPVAVIRDDRADAFAVMQLSDLLEFIREWWSGRQR